MRSDAESGKTPDLRRNRGGVRNRRGQAVLEAALVVPILLLACLGLVEAGNGLTIKHKMATLSREGANIASRGTSLDETLTVVMTNGAQIGLQKNGGAIITYLEVVDGDPTVMDQRASPKYMGQSRIGSVGQVSSLLQDVAFQDGQALAAVEVFMEYKALTPLASLLPSGVMDEIYERAIF
jgi:hypothetical protein